MKDRYRYKVFKAMMGLLFAGGFAVTIFFFGEKNEPLKEFRAKAAKTVSADTFAKLKSELQSTGESTVKLTKNITLSEKINVRGTKKLAGAGYTIRRRAEKGNEYKGTMFFIGKKDEYKGVFTLENVTVDGGGSSDTLKDNMQGRLIETVYPGSSLTLNTGVFLKKNYNVSSFINGGGGVTITDGCTMTMNDGSEISDNKTVIGGAAVRIRHGGKFNMKGGKIAFNSVYGKSKSEDYDGLGGAIHNQGTANLEKGIIATNSAEGYTSGSTNMGGLGGGIYNLAVLNLKGTIIAGNTAFCGGGGVYSTGTDAVVSMSGGALQSNLVKSAMGGGIYINNGSSFTFSGGNIFSNQATTGGGIYSSKAGTKAVLNGGFIFSNSAIGTGSYLGGGIRNNQAFMEIRKGSIGYNSAGAEANNQTPNADAPGYSSELFNNGTLKTADIKVCMNQETTYPFVNNGSLDFAGGIINGKGLAGVLNLNQMTFGADGASYPRTENRLQRGLENRGTLSVYGGHIKGKSTGLLNKGTAVIAGGLFDGNENYGVQAESGTVRIQGGDLNGKKYSLYGGGGKIQFEKRITVSSVYLKKGIHIDVTAALTGTGGGMIQPEDYSAGRLLVKAAYSGGNAKAIKSLFGLTPYQNFMMYDEGTGLYVGEKTYQVKFDSNGGSGTMAAVIFPSDAEIKLPKNQYVKKGYQFIGWSKKSVNPGSKSAVQWKDEEKIINIADSEKSITLYAVWRKLPEIHIERELLFYEGEKVPIRIIKKYITARDELDGDITDTVTIINALYENGKEIENPSAILTDKNCIGNVIVKAEVRNSDNYRDTAEIKVKIAANTAPQLSTRERYFFRNEISGKQKKEQEQILLENINFSDDLESPEELQKNLVLDSTAVNFDEEGRHKVTVSVKDQYGHRFYMDENKKEQYGEGKEIQKSFYVNIAEATEDVREEGYIRFISKEYLHTFSDDSKWKTGSLHDKLSDTLDIESEDECIQVWEFSSEEVNKAKEYAKLAANPFTSAANQGFYGMLTSLNCLKGGERL